MKENINQQIETLERQFAEFPRGYLVYKTIKGKKQPYLQWTEQGKTSSRYIKLEEREQVKASMEKRTEVSDQLRRLCAYRDFLAGAWKSYVSLKEQNHLYKKVTIGDQSFASIIEGDRFYIDKTLFIRAWWESGSQVTLITRPRRFGKTLNLDMVNTFFSLQYQGREELFEKTLIWKDHRYHAFQGQFPVISVSFAGIKMDRYDLQLGQIARLFWSLFEDYQELFAGNSLFERTRAGIMDRDPVILADALNILSELLYRHYEKKVLILVDEYDTPLQETWLSGNWQEASRFMRCLFHNTLKSNSYLKKALLTGITRVSKESMFSDLNHLKVCSVTSDSYSEFFGFTEEEVFAALDSQDMSEKEQVKAWYDGFCIGQRKDIYNPWSITNYLMEGKFAAYWANASSDHLLGDLLKKADISVKQQLEDLLSGRTIRVHVEEAVTFEEMTQREESLWGLLLASGYLKVLGIWQEEEYLLPLMELAVTNHETSLLLHAEIRRWFSGSSRRCCDQFIQSMLQGDAEQMTEELAQITNNTFSYFDVGETANQTSSEKENAENFYHGFVLGLLVTLKQDFYLTSNRESGRGRYDCMLEPKDHKFPAVILEFKVRQRKKEKSLEEGCQAALRQIQDKEYEQVLLSRGIAEDHILKYGICFDGKEVLCVEA